MIEELTLFRDFGIALGALILMFTFNKWVAERSFSQIERAQTQIKENNDKMFAFMDCTFQKNTTAILEMLELMREHIRLKDEAIDLLKRRER